MKNKYLFILVFLVGTTACNTLMGQGIEELVRNKNGGAYEKKITIERKPAILPTVREADVIWSKTVWRIIDMREKMNQHFYFPTREIQGRINLVNLLLKGIKENSIVAFDASGTDDNEFAAPISYDQVIKEFGATSKTGQKRNFETGQLVDVAVQQDIHADLVKQLMVKEIWYFDKQKSSLQVRILGICPIKLYYRDEDTNMENLQKKRLFWVYYPDIRKLLAQNESLNSRNGARNYSFDDLFLIRNFDGYIVREENIYDNRVITQYANDEYALQESERIKNSIFNYEQDLWEY